MTGSWKIMAIWVVLLTGGCVTESEIDYRLSTWSGAEVDQLIRIWGAPHGKHTMKDGTQVFTFEGSRVRSSGTFPANTQSRHCQVNFVIDDQSKIKSYYWRGAMDQCSRMIIMNPAGKAVDPSIAPTPKSSEKNDQGHSTDGNSGG